MARRSDHTREQLKQMILKKSFEIIGMDGFEGLSARRIADGIGYAPGTIYNLFESMDDLYLQLNAETLDRLYAVLNSAACNDRAKNPVQNMKKMAALYMKFARDNRPYWLMLFNHKLPEGRKAQAWYQDKIDLLFTPLENLLQPLFGPRQDKKRKMAARVLWSSVHGLCFLQETGKIALVDEKAPAETMAGYLIDTFVAGIKET